MIWGASLMRSCSAQSETVRQLRAGTLALAKHENALQDVKVLLPAE